MLAALESAKGSIQQRLDSIGWTNEVTGQGTTRDKTAYTAFSLPLRLTDVELANLYHGDDLAARMVDIVPDEMLREGFKVDVGDPSQNAQLADTLDALSVRQKLADGIRWGRLFGGGALLIGADDGRSAAAPLIPEKARAVSYLYELDKRFMWPLTFYGEPGHPKLGQPETYLISATSAYVPVASSIVHESRLLLFGGAHTGIQERQTNLGWDHSVLQRAYEAMRGFNTGWKAVEILLTDGNQAVFKMQGLAEAISADGTSVLQERLKVIDLFRSVMRALVIDAGDPTTGEGAEDFTRQNVQFAGIADLLDRFVLRLSAAVQIPVTILMGQSPAGMDATGDSDFRWFYDRIRSYQNLDLAPQIRRLVRVILRTKRGAGQAQKIDVTFPALWKESPKDEATRRATNATGDAAYVNAGILQPEEVALARFGGGGYGEEITLTPEAIKAREAILAEGTSEETPPALQLAPTDIAKVVTVNEARSSQGIGALMLASGGEDPDGNLTVAAYAAKQEAAQAVIGETAGGVEADEIDPDREPAPAPGGFGGPPAGAFGKPPAPSPDMPPSDEEPRADARDVLDELAAERRIVFAGGPRTGKSTAAVRFSERHGIPIRHGDSLIGGGEGAWTKASDEFAQWLDEPGNWICEGVVAPRGIRKWLEANPSKKLDATVVWFRAPMVKRSEKQAQMGQACETIWKKVLPELKARGVTVIERDA